MLASAGHSAGMQLGLQARACMSSTPLRPMLKPSILMSRLVGRDVSTPVTVRVLAAATAAADCSVAWPFAGASARLAKLTSLCRSADTSFQRARCQVRLLLASSAAAGRQPVMAPGKRRRQAHLWLRAKLKRKANTSVHSRLLQTRCCRCPRLCAVARFTRGNLPVTSSSLPLRVLDKSTLTALKHTSDTPPKVLG